MSAVKTCKYLHVVIQLEALVLPASLNDDSSAEDESHQEDGVPQLLQVLLTNRQGRVTSSVSPL